MNTTFLIADSGATKTDWLYVDGDETAHFQTQGLHPANIQELSDERDISLQLGELKPGEIFFFGTGCGNPVSDDIVRRFLQSIFPQSAIYIKSDLDGSGRAFFGKGSGVVAVLGTGSVSARIENGRVAKKSAALGFAIGDEGSAADIGRRLLKGYYRESVSPETVQFISEKLDHASYADMMNQIYTSGKPNRELASLAGKVLKRPFPMELEDIVKSGFEDFASHQLSTLNLTGSENIVFTGKVADVHKGLLVSVLKERGFQHVEVRYPVISSYRERIRAEDFDIKLFK